MLWGVEWQHWFWAITVCTVVLLGRVAVHYIWLWRLGPEHDFDLLHPEKVRTGVFRTVKRDKTGDGFIIPEGLEMSQADVKQATVSGFMDAPTADFTLTTRDGLETTVPVVAVLMTRYRCRRCDHTLDVDEKTIRDLHPTLARGCRPSGQGPT